MKQQAQTLVALEQELLKKRQITHLGGGKKRIEAHHQKGKMTARERIAALIDAPETWLEIATFAGDGMYESEGGCPSAGVVTGIGKVCGRNCVIVANDATVKAGAWFPITAKKNLRAQEIAMQNRLPIIYLVDSAGIYLPLQSEVFADKEHFGRIFYNNAQMSAMGITQIAAIMGSCVAGGAYLPIMSDEALIVEGTGSVFLAGPYLVKSAIGEETDAETLGGATTHSEISGVTDYKCKDDAECLKTIRNIIDKLGINDTAGFHRATPQLPKFDTQEIYDILPEDRTKPYDMRKIIERLVDNSEIEEYKQNYGQSIICGYARIDGWAVGIVANQRKVVKSKKGEMQMGGVIYSDSADKAARFIMNCNQKKIPLVFLQDVTGFMVGTRSEHGGIIKDGAKMIYAISNSIVPKFTIVVGNSYGAGNYAMCGKAYNPSLIFSWASAQIGVMSGASAAKTLLQIETANLKAKGETISPEKEQQKLDEITNRYQKQLSPYYAAAHIWIDDIITVTETRKAVSIGIESANQAPIQKVFNVGLMQV
jgi:acetyl-CoA carboxylase carboxyltransferase component